VATFAWDRAVVVRACAAEETVNEALGFDAGTTGALYEGIHTILFVPGDRIVGSDQFDDGLFRFDGPTAVIARKDPALDVHVDRGEPYLVPAAVGKRGPGWGPAGLEGCPG
jgi:hypothetical protein